MKIVNWRDHRPRIAHEAGIDWLIMTRGGYKFPEDPEATCLQTMMYIARALLQPGLSYHAHSHDDHEEIYYIIRGKGKILLDSETYSIRDGDCVHIPVNAKHSIINDSDEMIEFLAVAAPVN